MRPSRKLKKQPLWVETKPLAGVTKPRVAAIPMTGMTEHSDGRHQLEIILATESLLHTKSCVEQVLKTVAKRCNFHGGAWSYQEPFFFDLFANFFKSMNDNPAWVTICPQRITFKSRQSQRIHVNQSPGLMYPQFRGDQLGKEAIQLGGLRLPSDNLVMSPKAGITIADTDIVQQTIVRKLTNLDTRNAFLIREYWGYLATHDDQEDITVAKSGGVPALNQYFKKEENVQEAALLSLCKPSLDEPWIDALSLNLVPNDGRVLDFRFMHYPLEYYLVSNINNLTVVTHSTTDGCWQFL